VLQAAFAAQVSGVVDDGPDPQRAVFLQVDLDPGMFEGQVHRDLVAAVQQPGGEGTRCPAGDLGGEDDLGVLGAPRFMLPAGSCSKTVRTRRGSSKTRVRETFDLLH
jgi:hypothetical protein